MEYFEYVNTWHAGAVAARAMWTGLHRPTSQVIINNTFRCYQSPSPPTPPRYWKASAPTQRQRDKKSPTSESITSDTSTFESVY